MSTTHSSLDCSIFVGGLALSSVWQDVHDYLTCFGPVANLYLPRCQATGTIQGYAKATFASADSVARILSRPHHSIGGRCVGISLWKKKAEYVPLKDEVRLRKVHVRFRCGLPQRQLREYFSAFGEVEQVDVRLDPVTQAHRKFCYVLFRSPESAQEVARIRKHSWLGTQMICQMSKPAKSTPGSAALTQSTRQTKIGSPLLATSSRLSSGTMCAKAKQNLQSLQQITHQEDDMIESERAGTTSLGELELGEGNLSFSQYRALSPTKLIDKHSTLPTILEEDKDQSYWCHISLSKPTSKSYHSFFRSSDFSQESADRGNLCFRVQTSKGLSDRL